MNLKKHYLITMIAILILFFSIFSILTKLFLNKGFLSIEKKYKDTQINIIQTLLENEKYSLSNIVLENSYWNEIYNAVENKNIDWINNNLVYYFSSQYDYDFIKILDKDKTPIINYSKYDIDLNINKIDIINSTFKNSQQYTDLVNIDSNFYIISSSPIFDGLGNKAPSGYMIIADRIDTSKLENLIKKIYNFESLTFLSNKNIYFNIKYSTYIPLKNNNNETLGFIKIIPKKDNIKDYFYKIHIIFLIIFFIMLLIFIYFMNRIFETINSKIKSTVHQIDLISKGNYNIKLNSNTNIEEFDMLSNSVNNLSKTIKEKIDENNKNYIEIIEAIMVSLEVKDSYTVGHSHRVANYSKKIAKKLNLKNIREIEVAALIHDIGKLGIPESILNKPERLTDDEFDIIKTHPEKGYKILEKISYMDNIKHIVRFHHERIDGKGYPLGFKGNDIPLESKIIAVADAFDAMTSDRCYRSKFNIDQAVDILNENKGSQFDPTIVDCFIEVLNEDMEFKKSFAL
ncbi:HD domain-containing phosphohydrolase [Tepidibacter formicigenes]|jgi:putative nucleotidyltransferase with HDIG domain|uniref:HDIG domain-containing protein n=1 Tax=Tepidibacter formicigenes DSM 15518 TaxID=1123349 RepID=A0A1M6NEZ3_9FIRM|nr:HD domain-containing phosphohydrolase [Tepidibacter formicigenes]SHJ94247.1 HDIG domain-containing protein [Tepidibacter formicigenes DSM 15518]